MEGGTGSSTFRSGRLAVPHDVHAVFGEELTPFFFEGDIVGDVVEFAEVLTDLSVGKVVDGLCFVSLVLGG